MAKRASATDMILYRRRAMNRCCMAAISAPRGACSRAHRNLSSTCRPGSIPILIRCPAFRLNCSPVCRIPAALDRACGRAAARAYGARRPAHVVLGAGTQILLPLVAGLVRPGRAAILAPTYPNMPEPRNSPGTMSKRVRPRRSLRRCRARHRRQSQQSRWADSFARPALLALAQDLRRRGGVLVVDEAFMDVGPSGASLAADVARGNIVVLRSFGKFFGLAGVRLGFAIAAPALVARLGALLGPWAVSGPALAIGTKALTDTDWIERTRKRLEKAANKLDAILNASGLHVIGGTSLFRLVQTPAASAWFRHLGRAGIFVRAFPDNTSWLRFGLPGNAREWQRLQAAMTSFRRNSQHDN